MNFKIFATTAVIITSLFISSPNATAADVSVHIHGQVLPSIYGQVEIAEPDERYERVSRYDVNSPSVIYIEVPKQHRRHWRKHCHSYRACHQRVYFVEPRAVEYREYRRVRQHDHRHHHGHGRRDHH